MSESVYAIVELLLSFRGKNKEIQVFPHIRLDGDCIGSAAALAATLIKLGIPSKIYLDDPVPERLLFLGISPDMCEVFDADKLEENLAMQGAAVAVDCSEAGRMGKSGALFSRAKVTAVIDHHVSSGESIGTRYVVPHSASTAELVLHIIRQIEEETLEVLMDPFIANCLMVGIQSDTGRFSYQNTTPDTLRAAADLLESGANVFVNAYHLFDVTSVERMKLVSKALSSSKMFFGGKLALTIVTQDMLRDTNASDAAADGLVSSLRDIEGVVASFVIRESDTGEIRVNIRSREPFDSAAFAELFGGGGHHRAAGFSMSNQSSNEVCKRILDTAGNFFKDK